MRGIKIVDLNTLKNNYLAVKKRVGGKRVISVIKADAYGHGGAEVAKKLDADDGYAVATLDEAVEVKSAIRESIPVLILGATDTEEKRECVERGIEFTLSDEKEVAGVLSITARSDKCARVHIAVNTGMNRLGADWQNPAYKLINRCKNEKSIRLCGAFTHFYDAADISECGTQYERFKFAARTLPEELAHISSTCAIKFPEFHCGGVRLGLGLYGYGIEGVSPCMSIKCRVAAVNPLSAGETVGYGKSYTAKKRQFVAVLSMGYADGVPRDFSGEVLIGGKRRKIVGKACMDMCFALVDGRVKAGDETVFIGRQGAEYIDGEEFAANCGGIVYEALTGFRRIKREYIGKTP